MYHTLIVAIALAVACLASAEDSVKKDQSAPVGTWTHPIENGSWTLVIESDRMEFKATGKNGVATFTAPHYAVGDEGVMYGYDSTISSTVGIVKTLHPFAFRAKLVGETLTISDMAIADVDRRRVVVMNGEYKKKSPENASKPDKSSEQLKR